MVKTWASLFYRKENQQKVKLQLLNAYCGRLCNSSNIYCYCNLSNNDDNKGISIKLSIYFQLASQSRPYFRLYFKLNLKRGITIGIEVQNRIISKAFPKFQPMLVRGVLLQLFSPMDLSIRCKEFPDSRRETL